jgi:quinol monooxygenase YgiN
MAGHNARSGRFVIIAEFEVKPGQLEQFLALASTDASQSVAREPGCHQFDVTLDREQPNRVVLYEVYADEAAFDAHLETPHLAAFRAGIESLIVSRQVRRLTRVHG